MDQAIDNAKARLRVLCQEIGLNENEVGGRFRELEDAVENALSIYVGVVLEEIDELRDRCAALRTEIKTMQAQLSDVDFDAKLGELQAPYLPLVRELEAAKTKLLGWHAQRSKRAAIASERITELESALEEPKTVLPTDLSQNSICGMEARVADLLRLRDGRVAEMDKLAAEIEELHAELGVDTEGADEAVTKFIAEYQTAPGPWLAKDGTAGLRALTENLQREKRRRQERIDSLNKELSFLYEMLEIPPEDQLQADEPPLSQARLDSLQTELARLQEAKAAHMSKFIDRSRARLSELWQKMYFSDDEIRAFAPYYSTETTEEVLEACQSEIARIEALVHDPERLHLFAMVHRLKTLQAREAELERLEKDPLRFSRRGKERLEEQRMRSSVAKKPEVVQELKLSLEKWEETHEPFLVYGKSMLEEVQEEASKLLYRRPRPRAERVSQPPVVPPAKPRVDSGRVHKRPAPRPAMRPIPGAAAGPRARVTASSTPKPGMAGARRPLVPSNRVPAKESTAQKPSVRTSMLAADSSFDDPQMDLWRQKRERMLRRRMGADG